MNRDRNWDWGEALPRMVCDYIIVQFSALTALVIAAFIHIQGNGALTANSIAALMRAYYIDAFLPLSLIFPATFALSGFYSCPRTYLPRYKWQVIWRGALSANFVYLFASFLITRTGTLPRSSLLVMAVLVMAGTLGARKLKAMLLGNQRAGGQPSEPAASRDVVLVVGGAGYIGSILVRRLLTAGKRVRILDSLVYGDRAIRDVLSHPNCELMVGDCRNIQSVVAAVRGVRSVIHLAAIVGDPACEQDRNSALEVNYAATRMLIEIARGQRVQRFVFASSCSVYGASDVILDERSEIKPISLYAQTKCDSEAALLQARSDGFHPTILRFATIFGNSPRPRFDLVVNLLTAKAKQEGVITIFNGRQWRPFLHVDDVARAIHEVLEAPLDTVSGEIFNVGDSRLNHTLVDVAEHIGRHFPGTRVEQTENSDRRNYRVDFEKIRTRLGFEASHGLDDGILELKRAFDDGTIADYTDPYYHNQRYLQQTGNPANTTRLDGYVMAAFAQSLLSLSEATRQDTLADEDIELKKTAVR